MIVRRFANGDLLVPASGTRGDAHFDGREVAETGTPYHDEWLKWMERSGYEARVLSPEEEPLARAEAEGFGAQDPQDSQDSQEDEEDSS
jgi:hypothetical protein